MHVYMHFVRSAFYRMENFNSCLLYYGTFLQEFTSLDMFTMNLETI